MNVFPLGESLNIDPRQFYTALYNAILQIPSGESPNIVSTFSNYQKYIVVWASLTFILDPRSQRAGSYKFVAVIVNV